MAGTSLYAAKLATDKWHLSSAGFILLSLGEGILHALGQSGVSNESQAMFASGVMVFLPGMVFLCYYSGFPVWLRILGLLTMIPFLIVMIKIDMHSFDVDKDMRLNIIGFVMLQTVGLCWGYFAIRPYKKTTVQNL